MIHLSVNDKPVVVPSCWEEMTCHVYQRLMGETKEGDNAVQVFSALTGTPFAKVWESDKEDLDAAIYQAASFVFNTPQTFKTEHRAKTFRLGGKTVAVPEKISRLTVGQNFQLRQELVKARKEGKPLETLLSVALAVYLQPLVDVNQYNLDRARELEAEILKMNIFEVYPTAFFLLSRLQNSGDSGMQLLLRAWTRLTQWWRRLPGLAVLSLFMTFSSSIVTPPDTGSCLAWSSRNLLMSSCRCSTPGRSEMSMTNDLRTRRKS